MCGDGVAQITGGGENGAGLRGAEDYHQPGGVSLRGKLDAADLRGRDDVAGDANDEEVSEPLIEDDLRRDAGVGAAENNRERLLAARELGAPGVTHKSVGAADVRGEPEIPLPQPVECRTRWYHPAEDNKPIDHAENALTSSSTDRQIAQVVFELLACPVALDE